MALTFVLDENLRGALWKAIQQHNAGASNPLDAVWVGDLPTLPLGIKDPLILLWAESAGRILVTLDKNTIPGHLAAHLQAGHHSPGILMIRRQSTFPQVVSRLVLIAHAEDPARLRDGILYIP